MKVKFGARCPSCSQVYEIEFDTDNKAVSGASTIHCTKCKTHAALNIITTYFGEAKMVDVYPPVEPKENSVPT